jgi:hypothetical protein
MEIKTKRILVGYSLVLAAFEKKLRKATVTCVMSAWNDLAPTGLILMKFVICVFFFSKICRADSSFIKIWQEYRVLYMTTFSHLRHLAEFFLE